MNSYLIVTLPRIANNVIQSNNAYKFVCRIYKSNGVLIPIIEQNQVVILNSIVGTQTFSIILPHGVYSYTNAYLRIYSDNVNSGIFSDIVIPNLSIDCDPLPVNNGGGTTTVINGGGTTTVGSGTTTVLPVAFCPTAYSAIRNGQTLTINCNAANAKISGVGIGTNLPLPFVISIPLDRFNRNESTIYNFTISKEGCSSINGSYTLPSFTSVTSSGSTTITTTTAPVNTTVGPTTTSAGTGQSLNLLLGSANVYQGTFVMGYQSNAVFLNVVLDVPNTSGTNGVKLLDTIVSNVPAGKQLMYFVNNKGPYNTLGSAPAQRPRMPIFVQKFITDANLQRYQWLDEPRMNGNHAESMVTIY